MLIYIEGALLIAALAMSWAKVDLHLPKPLVRGFERFSSRPWIAALLLIVLVIVVRLALLPWMPIPQPAIHDEFSLLFGAKTFAMGRWTNPTHPMWTHLETFHILQQPTYMSMYPPAQAAALALGILAGNAWYAVLLMSALMVGAFVWMLRAWFSPSWSVIGGLLLVPFAILGYWTNSYWGGSLASLAAALMIGAAGRTWQSSQPRARDVLVFAAGTAVLLNRRPFEGALLLASLSCWMLYWGWKKMSSRGPRPLLRIAALLALVLVPCLAVVGVFNWKVTGSPLMLPYVKGVETRTAAALFLWMPLDSSAGKTYGNPEFVKFYREKEIDFARKRMARPLSTGASWFHGAWIILFGGFLGLSFLALPWAVTNPRIRPIVWITAANLAVIATEIWVFPHYLAPVFPLLWILLIECLRMLWDLPSGRGRAFVVAAVLSALVLRPYHRFATADPDDYGRKYAASFDRQPVIASISSVPGNHLVLVKYLPDHDVNFEWVYNEPDIDASRIVWARSLSPDQDREVIGYFSGRHLWTLDAGDGTANLREVKTSQ